MSTQPIRPRRSALYLPGNKPRALEKAAELAADVLILDLEDAVGPGAKDSARDSVCAAAGSGRYLPREVVIRINGADTIWHDDDLAAVAVAGADAVLVPKVESGEQVRELAARLTTAGAPTGLALWVMVETPLGFLHIEDIAAGDSRLAALVIGTNDLVNDLHAMHRPGRPSVSAALTWAVVAARAYGKVVLDGVFNTIADADGLTEEARRGREMGFDGKTVIHPAQIEPVNAAFGPSVDEVAHAQAVVSAYRDAVAAGVSGVIMVNGRMIESLHVRGAERTLALHERIAELSGTSA